MKEQKKAQSWSIDITLGVFVFIAAIFIFYALLNANQSSKASNLKEEASTVIKQVASEDAPVSVVNNNEIDAAKLKDLKNLQTESYDELKRKLRIEGDFCIYMEDENGNIVLIQDESGGYKGIGSQDIDLGGTPCSQQ
jgi:hypothetical protein